MTASLNEIDKTTLDLVSSTGNEGITAFEVNNELADFGIPRTAHSRLERLLAAGLLEKGEPRVMDKRCPLGQILGLEPIGVEQPVYIAKEEPASLPDDQSQPEATPAIVR